MAEKEIVQRVLMIHYKEKISDFKTTVDSVGEEIFLTFLHYFEFLQFSRKKYPRFFTLSLHDAKSSPIGTNCRSRSITL